jgi:ABC-type phosphate transport system auxiliary subunit
MTSAEDIIAGLNAQLTLEIATTQALASQLMEMAEEIRELRAKHDRRVTELIEANNRNIEARRCFRMMIDEAFREGARVAIAWHRSPIQKRTLSLNEQLDALLAEFTEELSADVHAHNRGGAND